MKLKYNLPKGQRCKKQTAKVGIRRSRYYYVECKSGYNYYGPQGVWAKVGTIENWSSCSMGWIYYPKIRVRSVKAFIRLLKKWSKYLPKGVVFELQGRYVNDTVTGQTT